MRNKDIPFEYRLDEETKTVFINWGNNGQLGRYGVPVLVKKYFPGYKYQFETSS